jgi:SNF2 family DNA or RNA helicase
LSYTSYNLFKNNIQELFSLLHFIQPKEFGSEAEFLRKYGNVENDQTQLASLHDTIRPFLLRRLKEDVEKSIPIKGF